MTVYGKASSSESSNWCLFYIPCPSTGRNCRRHKSGRESERGRGLCVFASAIFHSLQNLRRRIPHTMAPQHVQPFFVGLSLLLALAWFACSALASLEARAVGTGYLDTFGDPIQEEKLTSSQRVVIEQSAVNGVSSSSSWVKDASTECDTNDRTLTAAQHATYNNFLQAAQAELDVSAGEHVVLSLFRFLFLSLSSPRCSLRDLTPLHRSYLLYRASEEDHRPSLFWHHLHWSPNSS